MLQTKAETPEKKEKLINSALSLVLTKGYSSSSIDDICSAAGVTKGSFYHYFASKEEIGIAVLSVWGAFGSALYRSGTIEKTDDPIEQINLMFDVMIGFTRQDQPCVCAVGMISQEVSLQNEILRSECDKQLILWTEMVEAMLVAAKAKYPAKGDFDPTSVAWFLNSLWQGSMLVGKAHQDPSLIRGNLEHARSYVKSLFQEES